MQFFAELLLVSWLKPKFSFSFSIVLFSRIKALVHSDTVHKLLCSSPLRNKLRTLKLFDEEVSQSEQKNC